MMCFCRLSGKDSNPDSPSATLRRKTRPPHGLKIFKGSRYVVLNRTEADFMAHSPVANDLLEWAADMLIPDESFYATLARVTIDNGIIN